MVKGCQKKIIHVKDMGSKYYDEAYFILKPGAGEGGAEGDMIDEALKIAGESLSSVSKKKKRRLFAAPAVSFFAGLLAGGAAALVCALLL